MANEYQAQGGKPPLTGIKTFLSTRKFYGLSLIDWGWVAHGVAGTAVAYQAFNGINMLSSLGLDAPLYKVGIVTVAEVSRAVLSIANVWEEEINWAASTVLVLVLISNGGGDVSRIADNVPTISYNANVASIESKQYDMGQCTFYSSVLSRPLNQQEKGECVAMNKAGTLDGKWAKNCGCG